MRPPTASLLNPARIRISPTDPSLLVPDSIITLPDLWALPEDSMTSPLPAIDSDDWILTVPEDEEELKPLAITIPPPSAADAKPACISSTPPLRLPSPAWTEISPPSPIALAPARI